MELRKVQQTNNGTFFVSLPKGWATHVGLAKGAALAISESVDGRLWLDPGYGDERRTLSVKVGPTPYLSREIVGNYLLGYDEIYVESETGISPKERALVKRTSTSLVGLEIVEEDYSRVVLQCLLKPAASSPAKILRREYNIAASMHRDAVRAFLQGNTDLAKNVIARDVEVNRFYFLLVRTLRTVIQDPSSGERIGIHPIDCLDHRLCASLVETIGDRAVEIAHKALALGDSEISRSVSEAIRRFHSCIFEAQEKALKAFFEHDMVLAEEVRDERTKTENMLHDIELLVRKQSAKTVPVILAATSSMYRILGHSIDVADLVMPRKTNAHEKSRERE